MTTEMKQRVETIKTESPILTSALSKRYNLITNPDMTGDERIAAYLENRDRNARQIEFNRTLNRSADAWTPTPKFA